MDNPFHSTIREDIRFLGKLLGDTLKEQEGPATYQLIEKIRQLSVAYRHRDDRKAGRELDRRLAQLSPEQTVSVIRAFSYFSHLANLAEDQARLAEEEDEAQGQITQTFLSLRDEGLRGKKLREALEGCRVWPVLTAHPTEVQRKSVMDTERRIAKRLGDAASSETFPGFVKAARAQRAGTACRACIALADAHAAHRKAAGERRN